MSLPIGKQLQQARLARGLSLPDVQHRTRIRVHLLEAMENDDLSPFASLSYAKRFLTLYARHLSVDLGEYLETFQCEEFDSTQVGRVLLTLDGPAPTAPRMPAPPVRTSSAPAMIAATLAVLACGIAGAVWLGKNPPTTAETPPSSRPPANPPAAADVAAAKPAAVPEPMPEEPPAASTPAPILKALPADAEDDPPATPPARKSAPEVRRPLPADPASLAPAGNTAAIQR